MVYRGEAVCNERCWIAPQLYLCTHLHRAGQVGGWGMWVHERGLGEGWCVSARRDTTSGAGQHQHSLCAAHCCCWWWRGLDTVFRASRWAGR